MLVILYIGCEGDMLFARPEDTDVALRRWPTTMFMNEGPTNHMLPNYIDHLCAINILGVFCVWMEL